MDFDSFVRVGAPGKDSMTAVRLGDRLYTVENDWDIIDVTVTSLSDRNAVIQQGDARFPVPYSEIGTKYHTSKVEAAKASIARQQQEEMRLHAALEVVRGNMERSVQRLYYLIKEEQMDVIDRSNP